MHPRGGTNVPLNNPTDAARDSTRRTCDGIVHLMERVEGHLGRGTGGRCRGSDRTLGWHAHDRQGHPRHRNVRHSVLDRIGNRALSPTRARRRANRSRRHRFGDSIWKPAAALMKLARQE
jgi:hypothetical protein